MLVGMEWRYRHSASTGDEMPPYLRIWEDTAYGLDYKTADALFYEIMTAENMDFTSITWYWHPNAILKTSMEHDVIPVSSDLTDELDRIHHVRAMTYEEYLAPSR